jgi:YfiH family protein
MAGLLHGTTIRTALPAPGRTPVFDRLRDLRRRQVLPRLPTYAGEQVHEDRLVVVGPDGHRTVEGDSVAAVQDIELEAVEFARTDALMTAAAGRLLCIRTADCEPVFLIDPRRRVAGVAHCGWRGVRAGLATKLAAAFIARGSRPADLQAWLGPCITAPNYEVGAGLVADFASAFPGAPASPDGSRLDLFAITRWQLEQAGMAPGHIFTSGACTYGEPERYHSYRRDGEQAGRLLSFIAWMS